MSLDLSAATVADASLNDFVAALATREADRVLELFTDRASLLGSEGGECAIGRDAIGSFLSELCARPQTIRWEWQVTAAGRQGDVVWFVAPGAAVITGDDGSAQRVAPYRISGVLRSTGDGWLFELFNGAEPTLAA